MNNAGQRDKHRWRAELSARRAEVTAPVREAEAAALAAAATRLAADLAAGDWVAAYVPVGGEPGSTAMLDALRAAGARVLLPVTGPPGPLEWAEYTGTGALRRARYGLLEPAGDRMPPAAIESARVILVPALAVDRRGVRLGRGAGYYDRTLPAAHPDARLIVVVRDDELVDRLPEEPHDRRMGWVLTPGGGLRRLGGATGNQS
ncbi:5-formyltetrahydrofolate cyclo-ligase [Nocardia transvalensis]|uniref:5-formyltetrahydrofolate cyclo-ligase n=1 Tax=Nocardia transvalensis TaxID=37333 RepID=A0A7W9UIQ7_9NOCA|nr:5-formyltetrahydrofolate cyclo-ligase [Nocardia transvalensis]MBB5914644.1 5-formyltetrahydrofolate cyclo-ligase [Nocardia transvalensis]